VKIKLIDAVRARGAVQWLMANVGPQQSGAVGSVIHGTGWKCWVQLNGRFGDMEFHIELDQHVDDQDVVMFALKWS
jgi:hypothetical protein